uniref:egl nine homolog 1-like n=1 Tax=Scatophagus argus TaxID=75038 RepID=UPI001ED84ED3|nr:egl nine homolog 1-like [Scatophagus argus]
MTPLFKDEKTEAHKCSCVDLRQPSYGDDAEPAGTFLAAQVRIGVRVEFCTGVSAAHAVGNGFRSAARSVNWVEAGAANAFRLGTRSCSEVGVADWMGNSSRGRTGAVDGAGSEAGAGVGARNEAAFKDGDKVRAGAVTDRAGVPPCACPWSVHSRSKDRRHRSSHRLVLHYIVPCMNSYGMCIIDNFLGTKVGDRILQEVRELHHSGKMHDGKLASRGLEQTRNIRGDQIVWVEGKEPGCENIGYLLSRMDKLITYADGKLGKHKIRGRSSKV